MDKVNYDDLRRFGLFQLMSNEELESLAAILKTREFKPGEVIVNQGYEGDSMFIIKSGSVRITMFKNDQEKELITLLPDSFFGEIALFERVPRTATVIAAEESVLYEINRDNFAQLISQNPYIGNKVFFKIIQHLSRRLRNMNMHI